jgi:hypothetical protein
MNILKHMEAVFVVTVAALGSAAWLVDAVPDANARAFTPAASSVAAQKMQVVVIRAKRMTPEEKRHSLAQERAAAAGHRM